MPSDEEDAEVASRPKSKVPLWVIAAVVGVMLTLATVAGGAVYAFSGPSEQEIQDKHWEYEKVRAERANTNSALIAAIDLGITIKLRKDEKQTDAEKKAEIEKIEQQKTILDRRINELTQASLALERKYAKHWQQRGYKIRP